MYGGELTLWPGKRVLGLLHPEYSIMGFIPRLSGDSYFFANKKLAAKYAHNAAHATQARGGGPKVAFRRLPRKLHPGKRVAR